MSVKLYSFRQGDRSEYLAQYLLSELGICAPVPRQEDVGFDFHCSIFREERDLLSDSHQFLIQIKSLMEPIEYGGAFSSSGNWRKQDIFWLRNLSIPLLLGIVKKKEETISIFSTSAVQMVFFKTENPQTIYLIPRLFSDGTDQYSHEPSIIDDNKILKNDDGQEPKSGDGKIHKVDLGPPLVVFGIKDIKNVKRLIEIKALLRQAIEIHNEGILYRNIGAPFLTWTREIFTNKKIIGGWFMRMADDNSYDRIINRLIPLIMSLYLRAKALNDTTYLDDLRPLINRVPKDHPILIQLKNKFPDLFKVS